MTDWQIIRAILYAGGVMWSVAWASRMMVLRLGTARLWAGWAVGWGLISGILFIQLMLRDVLHSNDIQALWVIGATILCFTPCVLFFLFGKVNGDKGD